MRHYNYLFFYALLFHFIHVTFNFVFVFDYTLSIFISFYYSSSFFWMSKRTKQENSRGWKNFLRGSLDKNKIFHGTRFAQTPGKFYCFSVNTAKFLMPQLHLTRTFLLLNLVCFPFISYFTAAYYQKLYNLWLCAIKTCGNIALTHINLPKYEFGRSLDIQKTGKA